jgi:hypothetical protein
LQTDRGDTEESASSPVVEDGAPDGTEAIARRLFSAEARTRILAH